VTPFSLQALGGAGATTSRDVPRIDLTRFRGVQTRDRRRALAGGDRCRTKARYPLSKGTNAIWEYKSQVRPSTGTPDQKESYQITLPRMAKLWPSGDELPGFEAVMLAFERTNWALGTKVLSCLRLSSGLRRISSPIATTRCRASIGARSGSYTTCR